MARNCKLATLLQKRELYTKHREYNELSLLLLERQITLYSLWRNKLLVMLGLKLGGHTEGNLEVKVGVKLGAKNSVLAFLKCIDGYLWPS